MIEHSIKVHDRFTLELKLGLHSAQRVRPDRFAVNLWLFIPNSLDVNRFTYTKAHFYRDLKTYARLITPAFSLSYLASPESPPLRWLEAAMAAFAQEPTEAHQTQYEYHIKMFVSALKSSLRNTVNSLVQAASFEQLPQLVDSLDAIRHRYRSHLHDLSASGLPGTMLEFYRFGDEYMSDVMELHAFKAMHELDRQGVEGYRDILRGLIDDEMRYRQQQGYAMIDPENKHRNHAFVFRMGMLKKYAESHLFMSIRKRRDGVLAEQVLYSLAAGISMVVATAIAFSFQRRYGNFTMPLFVALVVGYMLKDRIKELARYFFAHRMGNRYYDHKIDMSLNGHPVGWIKEAMDFIPQAKVPPSVVRSRSRPSIIEADHRVNAEQTLLYRSRVHLETSALGAVSPYPIAGVNSIVRLNVADLLRKADNPEFPLYYPDERPAGYRVVMGERMYYLNIVLQLDHGPQLNLVPYRVAFNRNGIHSVARLENA